MKRIKKELTWDDLAKLYKEKNGSSAYIKSMDFVLDWAIAKELVKKTKSGGFVLTLIN